MALCLCVSVFQRKGCYQVFGLFPHLSVESVPELYWSPSVLKAQTSPTVKFSG